MFSKYLIFLHERICSQPAIEIPGLDPGAFEIVFFSTERFSNSLNLSMYCVHWHMFYFM